MKKFDNHVSKLQREMVDITNNLNKFRNKNHKTISLIINNLNVLSNEIAYNNNFGYDPNISNKNSQNDNSKTSVDLYKENKKQKNFSLQKNMEINKRNISNSLFSDNNNDNYMTFYISKNNNCVNKNQSNKTQTPRKQTLRINNIKNNKYNEYFNEFLNNDLKTNKNNQTFNRNNNKHKKIFKNNSISIKKEHKKENVNNRAFKNDVKYMKTEMGNKKKNNTITNLLFNNKKDFIYFNKNKQNYFKQNNNQQNSNKNQTSHFFHRNQDNKSHKNPKKINSFHEQNVLKNINNINTTESQENNKNNSFNDSFYYNLNNNNIENENSKKYENDENSEIKELLKLLKLKNNNDLKKKLNELYNTQIFANKVISIFHKNHKNIAKDDINLEDVLYWILSISNYKKENDEYKKYCKQLMKNNNINSFSEFKMFIDRILNKNIQNNNFIGGVKKILSTNIDDNSDFNVIDNINF
jgi:hypothetical protein